MGIAGKLALARPKNQLRGRMRCARANERSLALDTSENLVPGVVADVLERHRERLIQIDRLVEEINRALCLPLLQPLLAESRAQWQNFQRPEIATAARNYKLHRAEVNVGLHPVERDVPEIRRPPSGASRHRRDRLLVALLQLAQLHSAFAGMRAEWNHLLAIQRQRRRDVGYALFRRGFAQLVSLGQRDDGWHLCLRQEVQHGAIIFARVAPDVQQQDYTPQLSGPPQITFDERLPLRFTLLRDPRVTITWQIDQHEAVVDAEKIYLARPA